MARCKVKQFLASTGEEMYVLLDATGRPAYWPNVYVTSQLRDAALSPKTIRNNLRAIGMAVDWMAAEQGVDFNERMMTEDPLVFDEAKPLANFLKLTVKAQSQQIERARVTKQAAKQNRIVNLESVRPNHRKTAVERLDVIQDETAANAIRAVANYLEWIYGKRKSRSRAADFDPDRQIYAKEGINQLRANIPRVRNRGDEDEALYGLTIEHCRLIEEIVRPHSERNPWRDPFVKDRNYVIWRLFLETGGRRGEIHNIKVSDFTLPTQNVTFRVSKTIPRSVSFSRGTSILVDEYVKQHWYKLPRWARQAGYLITDVAGDQLSERRINQIFEEIRESHPEIPDWLTPHTLRRTWNEILSRRIDAMTGDDRWSEETERRVRNRLMGWSENSQMAGKYLRRHTKRKADEISQTLFEGVETVSNPNQEADVANDN